MDEEAIHSGIRMQMESLIGTDGAAQEHVWSGETGAELNFISVPAGWER